MHQNNCNVFGLKYSHTFNTKCFVQIRPKKRLNCLKYELTLECNQLKSVFSFPPNSGQNECIYQFTQNDLVDIVAKMLARYRITAKIMQSTQPKQSIASDRNTSNNNNTTTADNNDEHTINKQSLRPQSIKNHNHRHCERYENELQPRKKSSAQWSISSVESQQIINCDAFTVKVSVSTSRGFSHVVIDHIHMNTMPKERHQPNQPNTFTHRQLSAQTNELTRQIDSFPCFVISSVMHMNI